MRGSKIEVYGRVLLGNGESLAWLQFVDTDCQEEAELIARQTVATQHRVSLANCWVETKAIRELVASLELEVAACRRYLSPGCTVVAMKPWLLRLEGAWQGAYVSADGATCCSPLGAAMFSKGDAKAVIADCEDHRLVMVTKREAINDYYDRVSDVLADICRMR